MRSIITCCAVLLTMSCGLGAQEPGVPATGITPVPSTPFTEMNPRIDAEAYLKATRQAMIQRQTRRLSEADFITWSQKPGVVILDARSKDKYDMLHVRGAVNLPYPDMSVQSLKDLLPDKDVTILIYCNNNFAGNEQAFASKMMSASLNTSTYTTLYAYGYRNVYELGPLLEIATTRILLVKPVWRADGSPTEMVVNPMTIFGPQSVTEPVSQPKP